MSYSVEILFNFAAKKFLDIGKRGWGNFSTNHVMGVGGGVS